MLKMSVVVCARNAEKTIGQCLEAIKGNQPSEIIVIAGGCTDRTVEIAHKYTDKVHITEGKNLAYDRQVGVEKATEDYLAYVDSDAIVPPGCLERLLQEKEEKGYVAIEAQILSWENKSYWQQAEDQTIKTYFNKEGDRHLVNLMATVFSRDALIKYKFDPFAWKCEELDLCYRLSKEGHRLGIASVSAYHLHRATFTGFARQRIGYGQGYTLFLWKHKLTRSSLAYFLRGVIPSLDRVPRFAKQKNYKMIPYVLLAITFASVGMVKEFLHLSKEWMKKKMGLG